MTKQEKAQYIDDLTVELKEAGIFYLADTSDLTVETINALRRKCFQSNVRLKVVKNTLLEKAMDNVTDRDFGNLRGVLSGPTSILFAEVGNLPAKIIKDFRKKKTKPLLKGAYIEESVYIGDDQLEVLESIKSKEELIGEIIGLLQSPMKNVVSGLKGQGGKIAGILKTLSERA